MKTGFGSMVPIPRWLSTYDGACGDVKTLFRCYVAVEHQHARFAPAAGWLKWMGLQRRHDTLQFRRAIRRAKLLSHTHDSRWSPTAKGTAAKFARCDNAQLREALTSDSVGMFELHLSLGNFTFNRSTFCTILSAENGQNLCQHCLEEKPQAAKILSDAEVLQTLLCHCPNEAKVLALLPCLQRRGLNLSEYLDGAGFTPLTYTLFARRRKMQSDTLVRPQALEDFLLAAGCDAARQDFLGMSWQDVAEFHYRNQTDD